MAFFFFRGGLFFVVFFFSEREKEERSLFASSHCRVREVWGAEGDAEAPLNGPLAACQSHSNKPPSDGVMHTHPQTCAGKFALFFCLFCYFLFPFFFLHCTRQSLISQLQQIRTSVTVFDPKCAGSSGGNSDISV